MGTLFEQPERNYKLVDDSEVDALLTSASKLAVKHKIEVGDVIRAYKVTELKRANDLYAANGDIFDEQMAGIGELLRSLVSVMEERNERASE